MRITYIYQFFVTPDKPGSHRCYEVCTRLANEGHDVHVVSSNIYCEHTGWKSERINGFTAHRYPVFYKNRLSFLKRIYAFMLFICVASRKAKKIQSDVIFASSTPLTICIPAVVAAKALKVPMVFEVRDLWPEMPIAVGALKNRLAIWAARRLERFAYRNAARVVALSPGMADGVAATGYPRGKIHVIPNSCDLDRFAPNSEARNRFAARVPEVGKGPVVLYAGTMGRVNEVTYLVGMAKAMRERNPDVRFVVFGEGSEEQKTRELAEREGVLGLNYFQYGRIPKEQVVDAFLAADVVTSLFAPILEMEKNSANKFFDGLAAGKPIVINYGGWQAELLRETGAGLVLDRDPEAAARELAAFLADTEKVEKAGQAARKLAEERFSRDKLAQELETVLLTAVGEREPRKTRKARK